MDVSTVGSPSVHTGNSSTAPTRLKDADGDHDGTTKAAPKPDTDSGKTDSVRISDAAQKMQQEATETPAQTAQEAAKGDAQAKRLLAREDAEKAAQNAPPQHTAPEAAKGNQVDVNA